MKRNYAHTTEEINRFQNDRNYIYGGKNDSGTPVFLSTKAEDVLSPKELDVYVLWCRTDEEIADALGISEKTVQSYRRKITLKIQA